MHRITQGMIAVAAAGLLSACSTQTSTGVVMPTGTVAFSEPAGGEVYQMGDTVTWSWSCSDCTNVPADDYLQVFAYDGQGTYLVADTAQMTDSASWVVGTSLQNVTLLPGTYMAVAQDVDGYYQAQSRFFDLAATAN
ncbi:MAG: hypothetical protein LJF04_10945 [Gemmatimonadetes bacterium]|nr:hypothetical protein [Gemmatimonadota bacterium]